MSTNIAVLEIKDKAFVVEGDLGGEQDFANRYHRAATKPNSGIKGVIMSHYYIARYMLE